MRIVTLPARYLSSTCRLSRTSPSLSSLILPYIQLGTVPYNTALRLQQYLVQRRLNSFHADTKYPIDDLLLLLQHPPTYTTGRRNKGKSQEIGERRLRALGAEYFETSRGGQTTFHGPGQLIIYPILDIRNYKLSARCYVSALENSLINTLAHFSLAAHTTPDTGVWLHEGSVKIAAIGVHLQRYISSHGCALNVDTDIGWFRHIVPCGLEDKGVTSISMELNRQVKIDEVMPIFLEAFGAVFERKMIDLDKIDGGLELKEEIEGIIAGK